MSARIPLRKAGGIVCAYALVDAADEKWLAAYRWSLTPDGYARRNLARGAGGTSMHREILGLEKGDPLHSDHINGDRLDNRRENLRIVTQAQNNQNVRHKVGRSGHRGVYWHAFSGTWHVQFQRDGKKVSGGYFHEVEDAVVAARELRRKVLPFAMEEAA